MIKPSIFGKQLFGKNYKNHPYYKKFKKENFAFIDFKYEKLIKNLKDKNFVSPEVFKKKIKKKIGLTDFLQAFILEMFHTKLISGLIII